MPQKRGKWGAHGKKRFFSSAAAAVSEQMQTQQISSFGILLSFESIPVDLPSLTGHACLSYWFKRVVHDILLTIFIFSFLRICQLPILGQNEDPRADLGQPKTKFYFILLCWSKYGFTLTRHLLFSVVEKSNWHIPNIVRYFPTIQPYYL